jgi:hypothetical protein
LAESSDHSLVLLSSWPFKEDDKSEFEFVFHFICGEFIENDLSPTFSILWPIFYLCSSASLNHSPGLHCSSPHQLCNLHSTLRELSIPVLDLSDGVDPITHPQKCQFFVNRSIDRSIDRSFWRDSQSQVSIFLWTGSSDRSSRAALFALFKSTASYP